MAYRNRSTRQGRDAWEYLVNNGIPDPHILSQGQTAQLYYHLSSTPIMGDLIRWRDNWNAGQDYLDRYGMTWDDVQYPSRLPGSGDSYSTMSRIISKSARYLYR